MNVHVRGKSETRGSSRDSTYDAETLHRAANHRIIELCLSSHKARPSPRPIAREAPRILSRQRLPACRGTLRRLDQQVGSPKCRVPLAAESGSEYRRRLGRRLGQQPREQQRRPIQRRVLRGARKHVDECRRRREGGGGWDRGRERLEGVEGGGLRGAVAQSLGHGICAEVHVRGALVRPARKLTPASQPHPSVASPRRTCTDAKRLSEE
jgi:hypothetical protein